MASLSDRPTSPAMNQRELSKALTAILGRKPRKDRGIPRSPTSRLLRTPSYRRVTAEEVARYLRIRRRGLSARAIARKFGRSHATVNRWLTRDSSEFVTAIAVSQ